MASASRQLPWETRGEPARYGTWRALAWSVFIALAFFELTNPARIVPDFPGANGVLAALTGVVLILDRRNVRLPRVPWTILVYLGLCALSVLWSINRSDTIQMTILYAWIALLACICVAQTDTQTLLRGVAWGGVLVVLVTLASVAIDPERFGGGLLFYGTGPGVHGSRGIVAYSVVLALTAALARWAPRPLSWVELLVTIALNVVGVVIAPAATGRVAAVAIVVVWLALRLMRRLDGRLLTVAWVVILALAVAMVVLGVLYLDRVSAALGRSSDFSGRFEIWRAIIPTWLDAPIAGYGFGAVWFYGWWRLGGSPVLDDMAKVTGFPFYHGHNLVMDVLPQLGALGALAALLMLAVLAARAVANFSSRTAAPIWALLMVATLLIMGVAEPILSVPVGWFCAIAATSAARERSLSRSTS